VLIYVEVGLFLVVLVYAYFRFKRKSKVKHRIKPKTKSSVKTERDEPYGDLYEKALLTENEKEFYGRLLDAFPDCHVLPQVSMGALIQSEGGVARHRFAQKIVDFVVCDTNLEVIALIELDDRTHSAEKDYWRDKMTGAAGYVTHRFESKKKPYPNEIRRVVLGR
jgi:hypothetical protein